MRFTRRQFVAAAGAGLAALTAPVRYLHAAARRLPRSEAFFGVHFDLHPTPEDKALGRDLTEAMIASVLDQVRPDFVEYDSKGHPGYMAYPSRVQEHPALVQDSLALWRKGTRSRDIPLYIHFSGLFDALAARQHPDWAAVRPDGTPHPEVMSVFGPYADGLLLPELREVISKYDLDGAWMDGDCWAAKLDYGAIAARRFQETTGLRELPKAPGQPGWQAFLEIARAGFRDYLAHYTSVLKKEFPQFQLTSNWAYGTHMPEKPAIRLDYLSGDTQGNAQVDLTRTEARFFAAQGIAWDLMSWGFQPMEKDFGFSPVQGGALELVYKTAVQMNQEAAVTMAQGGAVQVYLVPTRSGFFDQKQISVMAQVADFCRPRRDVCHNSQTVPEIGVLYSGHSIYATSNEVFTRNVPEAKKGRGIVEALISAQYSVDLIPDWKLTDPDATGLGAYRLIVVPDWTDIGTAAHAALVALARAGASLMVIGAENARRFEAELGVAATGPAATAQVFVPTADKFAALSGIWLPVAARSAEVILRRFSDLDTAHGDDGIAATLAPLGKGRILGIYGPLGDIYFDTHDSSVRQILQQLIARVFTPRFAVQAPPLIETVLRRKNGKQYLHLLNASGIQLGSRYATVDYISPVGPIAIRAPRDAGHPRACLEGTKLQVEDTADGRIITINKLAVHEALEFNA